MKLNIVAARDGVQWARDGVRVFFRQPLAMAGLFFMFMAALSLAAFLPLVGGLLALVLVPALTVGLMAAARTADEGRFPMPSTLFIAFRQGPQATRAMLMLGLLYAVAVLLVMGVSALIDGGRFAQLYVNGGGITPEVVTDPQFRVAMWASTLLYLPVSVAFWHAPALVHWHGVAPVKSLFFSLVAVVKNTRAYLLYGLVWMALSFAGGLLLLVLAAVSGSAGIASAGLLPVAMLVASMFFTSLWFTFRDCFSPDDALPATEAP
ncbi:BPSS1780 family membrane protein [Ottowia sp.]|uniref:BPSS1780 family membrane protein n=1 Tax=Ottowia sp. TaxID=1898956 RepID=UPI002C6DB666|nr:BPSS1780 family membrane protein [Ottowia sp.]HOB66796.1 BPSS1780 family membrane protein [Ottowia sp.]HPZ57814.1 BPSS1780 family membrane protein [Ottowia sp.]HQD47008.1 BPSS1780 family membrane protein [Ottowia sp.]